MCGTYNTTTKLNMNSLINRIQGRSQSWWTKKTPKEVFKYFLCWVVSSLNVTFQYDCSAAVWTFTTQTSGWLYFLDETTKANEKDVA